ncbi:MAG: hypothetical protein RIS69_104, partial [Actinomycetota bacterium]
MCQVRMFRNQYQNLRTSGDNARSSQE